LAGGSSAHASIKKTFGPFNFHSGEILSNMFPPVQFIFVQSLSPHLISPPLSLSRLQSWCYTSNDFTRTAVLQFVSISLAKTHTYTHTRMHTSSHITTTGAAVEDWGRGEELSNKPHFIVRRLRSMEACFHHRIKDKKGNCDFVFRGSSS